jgi:hypothetical protein
MSSSGTIVCVPVSERQAVWCYSAGARVAGWCDEWGLMRLIRASLDKYVVSTAMSVLIAGCLAYPAAHADATYGPGFYAVPSQLPYGVYIAHAEPGNSSSACTFSTWTSDGKFISSDDGILTNSVTARIVAPAIAKFITHGCTPWVKVG